MHSHEIRVQFEEVCRRLGINPYVAKVVLLLDILLHSGEFVSLNVATVIGLPLGAAMSVYTLYMQRRQQDRWIPALIKAGIIGGAVAIPHSTATLLGALSGALKVGYDILIELKQKEQSQIIEQNRRP
jgi:hypothetical protein